MRLWGEVQLRQILTQTQFDLLLIKCIASQARPPSTAAPSRNGSVYDTP